MTVRIHRIDTLLPDFSFAQEEAMVKMMKWARGNRGFDIALSSCVPKLIGLNIRELIGPALAAGVPLSPG